MSEKYINAKNEAVPSLIKLIDNQLKENDLEFSKLYEELGIAGILRYPEFKKLSTLLSLNYAENNDAKIEERLKELKEQCDELIEMKDKLEKIKR